METDRNPFTTSVHDLSSFNQLTEGQLFDNFVEILSNQSAWKNICKTSDALNLIETYYKDIIPYIVAKKKAKIVIEAISKNSEITQNMKEYIITYLEQRGVICNKYEMLFEYSSRIYINNKFKLCDDLSTLIKEKLVDPNFQTNVGTIFHIFAKLSIPYNDASIQKQCEMLIGNGCDLYTLNKDGKTAIELAIEEGNLGTASFLKDLCLTVYNDKNQIIFLDTKPPSPSPPNPPTIIHCLALVGFVSLIAVTASLFKRS
jgi:hypothetical protein